MKTILEINYKLIFDDQEKYVTYLDQTQRSQPELYDQILATEKLKDKTIKSFEPPENALAKRIRSVRVYELGLANVQA